MIKIDKIIVVEGKYDKIKLSSFLDAVIIPTNGFRIFKDKQKLQMIKDLSKDKGLIIITDSDSAGFVIRNYLKGTIDQKLITNVYIPEVFGKEKRKSAASKEGKLGVEGLSEELIKNALLSAGVSFDGKKSDDDKKAGEAIEISDFYKEGLIGSSNSKAFRLEILKRLGLPEYLSTKSLLEVINLKYKKDEFELFLKDIRNSQKNEELV
ncbi:MAG: DUF4093 domain-containing protein [Clostridia bacterium]|nr:DUF4093 domain-containing protein [Clostridia bacterium]